MANKLFFGIKLKMTLVFSAVFIAMSFSFNLYTYQRLRTLLTDDNNNYLLERASAMLNKTEISPAIIPLPDKNTYIRVSYHSGGKQIIVFESPGIINKIKTPLKKGVTDTLNMRVAYVYANSDENPAELTLVTSAEPLQKNLNLLIVLLFACSIISVLLAGPAAYVSAFYLLKPIQRIIAAAKTINTRQLRDIIPVKNTRDELQELTETINSMLLRIDTSVKQQQNFFASASHELKTPLAIMRAELELGLKKPGLETDIAGLLSSQLEEINRLQQTVQEFLVVSQLKSGGLTVYKERIDLSAIILKAFNRLRSLFPEKGLQPVITFDKEMEDFTIVADIDKLWIILINLLENAVKYSVPGGKILCTVQKPLSSLFIQINITNSTFEEAVETGLLLDAFYRADVIEKGSGLGLWLCNQLITVQEGKMTIQSKAHQFTVEMLLPLIEEGVA